MVVYHATRISSISSILENGFCPSKFEYSGNESSAKGVYFSKDMFESVLVMMYKIKERGSDHCIIELEIDSLEGFEKDPHEFVKDSYFSRDKVTNFKILKIYDYSEKYWNGSGRCDSYDWGRLAKHLTSIKDMMPLVDTESVA